MRRITLHLKRENPDLRRLTLRYRLEFLWSADRSRVLMVTRYGYQGNTGFFQLVDAQSIGESLHKTLERFGYLNHEGERTPGFEVTIAGFEESELADEELTALLMGWKSDERHPDKAARAEHVIKRFVHTCRVDDFSERDVEERQQLLTAAFSTNLTVNEVNSSVCPEFGVAETVQPSVVSISIADDPIQRSEQWGIWS
jgi:hypothetical protein